MQLNTETKDDEIKDIVKNIDNFINKHSHDKNKLNEIKDILFNCYYNILEKSGNLK